jgi:hypothetical protein
MDGSVMIGFVIALALSVATLAALGAGAIAFGADSRPTIGDDHGPRARRDWI